MIDTNNYYYGQQQPPLLPRQIIIYSFYKLLLPYSKTLKKNPKTACPSMQTWNDTPSQRRGPSLYTRRH